MFHCAFRGRVCSVSPYISPTDVLFPLRILISERLMKYYQCATSECHQKVALYFLRRRAAPFSRLLTPLHTLHHVSHQRESLPQLPQPLSSRCLFLLITFLGLERADGTCTITHGPDRGAISQKGALKCSRSRAGPHSFS